MHGAREPLFPGGALIADRFAARRRAPNRPVVGADVTAGQAGPGVLILTPNGETRVCQAKITVPFPVKRRARPARSGEEDPDAPLPFRVAVVDDVGEHEVGGVDADAGLLGRFADGAFGDGLAVLQVPAGGGQSWPSA